MKAFSEFAKVSFAVFLAAIFAFNNAQAEGEDAIFRGKTVSVLVGFGTGGGYDTYGRVFIRHFREHIPGRPDIILQNMPGAGGLAAANFLASSAKTDGTAIAMFAPSVLIQPLIGNKNAQFDPRQIQWIGKLDYDGMACVVRADMGVKRLLELRDKEIAFASSGSGSNTTHHVEAMKALVGIKAKIVQGYKGSADMTLALRRGEVGAMCGVAYSNIFVQLKDDLARGDIRMLVQLVSTPLPDFESVDNIYDFVKSGEDRSVATLIFKPNEFGKALGLPAKTPHATVEILRKAFRETVADQKFNGEMNKMGMPLYVADGKAISDAINNFYAMPANVIDRVRTIIRE